LCGEMTWAAVCVCVPVWYSVWGLRCSRARSKLVRTLPRLAYLPTSVVKPNSSLDDNYSPLTSACLPIWPRQLPHLHHRCPPNATHHVAVRLMRFGQLCELKEWADSSKVWLQQFCDNRCMAPSGLSIHVVFKPACHDYTTPLFIQSFRELVGCAI
jgi:hypothetical protein